MSSVPDSLERTSAVPLLRWRGRIYAIIGLAILLVLVAVLATTIGSVGVPFATTFQIILSKIPFTHITPVWPNSYETIILDIRLPRVILAGLIGAALATAGATYQGLFRNPLADPYLIGAAPGACLGAIIGFLLPAAWMLRRSGIIPLFAFVGAIVSTAIVYGLARGGRTLPVTTLILAGVALRCLL